MFNVKTILVLVAGIFYLLKNLFHFSPLYINIMNDLLAVPVFLVAMELLMRLIYGYRFKLTLLHVLFTAALISILFEGIFPMVSNKSISDPMDVWWYFAGGFGYFWFLTISLAIQRKRATDFHRD